MEYPVQINQVSDNTVSLSMPNTAQLVSEMAKYGKDYKASLLTIKDDRSVTTQQRAFAFALINDIADSEVGGFYAGIAELVKQYFYALVQIKYGVENMTLSIHGDMTSANLMIDELIEFVIEHDIPLSHRRFKKHLIEQNEKWEYLALMGKFDVIDGTRPSDLHHIDTVGIGNNRNKISHVGKRVIQLSRKHHNEAHNIGWKAFSEKYKIKGIEVTPEIAKRLKL